MLDLYLTLDSQGLNLFGLACATLERVLHYVARPLTKSHFHFDRDRGQSTTAA